MPPFWNKDKYADLPLLTGKPSPLGDDDVAFHSDLSYCRDLLNEIHIQAFDGGRVAPFPLVLSDELDHAITEMAGIKARIKEMRRG